jgi:tetratricopeptide (TPR) repeat protein
VKTGLKAGLERMAFPLPEKPSIAVLPFTNMSGDPAQEYIGDGISENIISALSVGPGMFVIARNSTFAYKGRSVKVQQIAEGELVISLDPNFSTGHAHLAQIMLFAGRFDEAIALTEKAMRLSPYYPAFYLSARARSYAFKKRYEEALASSKQLHDRSRRDEYPEDWALVHLAGVYAASDRQDEARACMAQALKINPGLSMKFFKQTQPFKNPDHLQREIEALTRAGLPHSGK